MDKALISFKFRVPGFWTGYASVLDWLGTLAPTLKDLYGSASTPSEVDAQALENDWAIVRNKTLDFGMPRVSVMPGPFTEAAQAAIMLERYQQILDDVIRVTEREVIRDAERVEPLSPAEEAVLMRKLYQRMVLNRHRDTVNLKRPRNLDSQGNELEELTGRT